MERLKGGIVALDETKEVGDRRALATKIAFTMHGVPYKYGGMAPFYAIAEDYRGSDMLYGGLDCSEVTEIVCRGITTENHFLVGQTGLSANDQWVRFSAQSRGVAEPREGCLVFYGKPSRVTHVMYCLNGETCIGATGGTGETDTIQEATKDKAYVKVIYIKYRKDIVGYCDICKQI